nr:ALPV-304 [Albatrosspox virus]
MMFIVSIHSLYPPVVQNHNSKARQYPYPNLI